MAESGGYVHPEKLVSTEWVAEHLNAPGVRIVESNEDILLYSRGHVPGAVHIDWVADLNDPIARDYLTRRTALEGLDRRDTAPLAATIGFTARGVAKVLRRRGTRRPSPSPG